MKTFKDLLRLVAITAGQEIDLGICQAVGSSWTLSSEAGQPRGEIRRNGSVKLKFKFSITKDRSVITLKPTSRWRHFTVPCDQDLSVLIDVVPYFGSELLVTLHWFEINLMLDRMESESEVKAKIKEEIAT